MPDTTAILQAVLTRYADHDKWVGSPFEAIKRVSNTKVGDIGLDFVEAVCEEIGLSCEFPLNASGERVRTEGWDVKIEGRTFELKTATEDVNGAFQFNHIRYHRDYEALLCVGVSPAEIFVDAWTKGEVATGDAGKLVSMDKGSSATHKLTRRREQMRPVGEFEQAVRGVLERLAGG